MRYLSIYLQNYIGIYNGMGLSEIHIDFSICKNRMIVIRGDNGSGKSTLMNAISVFPDSNDQFIPGKSAMKEVVLQDGSIIYKMTFIHGVKNNGQRETTKAYITKTINGLSSELNENGNVSSYKDIIMEELGMDPSFESLSHLSTDNRGIADKKPIERKKFVSATLSNLEVYNDIYKSISKQCQQYKNLINSIVAKLGTIGDPNVIASNVDAIESKINILQDQKDQNVEKLASAKASIELLDPDGSIQDIMKRIEEENAKYSLQLEGIGALITNSRLNAGISLTDDIFKMIEDTKSIINNINIDNQLLRGKIEVFLMQRESESNELSSKIQKLKMLEQNWKYDFICEEIKKTEVELQDILKRISITGIDPSQFSKETYIAALETINRVSESISVMKEQIPNSIFENVLTHYIHTGSIISITDVSGYDVEIEDLENRIKYIERDIIHQQELIKTIEILKLRPGDCKNNDCPFIANAFKISLQDPEDAEIRLSEELKNVKTRLSECMNTRNELINTNLCISQFSNLLRDIRSNTAVIVKLPGGEIFNNLPKFIDDVFHHNLIEYFNSLYQYIYLANDFDQYKALSDMLDKLYSEKKTYESKQEVLEEVQGRIDEINIKLDELNKQIIPIQSTLSINDKKIIELQNKLSILQIIADKERELAIVQTSINENNRIYNQNLDKIKKIHTANTLAVRCISSIESVNKELSPLNHERDRLNHQMRMIDEYNKELDQLNNQFKIVDLIRYYASPKTGIQLAYMELYMGNMIAYANQLLELFFYGRFKIMPFIINESEFRIPCAGDGLMNDDISSMSSAQIAMISMVISFAILYTSSSKYNILKLDEIDGPLDGSNRIMFSEVLYKAMDMLHVEQTIMISHNSEFDENQADLIILKTSESIENFYGNIIWKY